MDSYKRRQDEGFAKLNEILQKKGPTEKIQECIKRLEEMFYFYVIMDLDWETVLHKSEELDGDELEKFLLHIVAFVESYDE